MSIMFNQICINKEMLPKYTYICTHTHTHTHTHTYIYIYIYVNTYMFTHMTYDFLVQVRNFLLPLSLKVFRYKERDTIFLCCFSICPTNTYGACSAQIRLASARSQYQPTDLSQISAHASGAWRHSYPWSHPLSGIYVYIYIYIYICVCVCVYIYIYIYIYIYSDMGYYFLL